MSAENETGLKKLQAIYALHAELTEALDLACSAGCDACCTRNVSVTSLEAGLISNHLEMVDRSDLVERLKAAIHLPRFKPLVTTNGLAHLCRLGKEPPEETVNPDWRPCPFLVDHHCSIYAARPFACRCMVSKSVCQKGGQAEIDDYWLSLHTVFMQFIEHAAADGVTGNLIDMLAPEADSAAKTSCVPNRPIEMILLPPKHQSRGQEIIARLSALFP
jgi:Fe-S-cluster containining protein